MLSLPVTRAFWEASNNNNNNNNDTLQKPCNFLHITN